MKTTKKNCFVVYLNSVTPDFVRLGYSPELNTLPKVFNAEYGWRVKQGGLLPACKDYLMGLGGTDHEYMNYDIIKLFENGTLAAPKSICAIKNEDKRFERLVDYYWDALANALAWIVKQEEKEAVK